jgi:hypothetical protein
MTLTKRDKTLLIVFLIGLVALVADRTILRPQGGPGAAAADGAEDPGQAANHALAQAEQPAEERVADRLNRLWSDNEPDFEQVKNPFALPNSWFQTPDTTTPQVPDVVAAFIRTHRLTAVVVDGDSSYAVLDERFLVPGEAMDGFLLISVGDRSAVFERDGREIVLELMAK